jgi:uncharacterized membrane protein (DUF2068 family)
MDEQERHDDTGKSRQNDGAGGSKRKSDLGLTIIGIGKLIKVTVLVTVGVAALAAVNHDPPQMLMQLANTVGFDHDSRHLHRLVEKVSGVSQKELEAIGFASFVYAALFGIEGVGLLMKKRWAEYFTMVITVSFIPLELYEIIHRASIAKIVTLVLNVIVFVYLVMRVRRDRRERHDVSDRERGPRPVPAPLGIASR